MKDPSNFPDDRLYILNDRQLNRIKLIIRFCIKNVTDINADKLNDLLQELILLEDIDDFIFNEFDPIIEDHLTFNFEELLRSVGLETYGGTDTKNK
mgnify:CR=1 FL=1|tara:strand:- start:326 stop:613 length:288 start_codon:yes stop_codon:yes gene_type:complete